MSILDEFKAQLTDFVSVDDRVKRVHNQALKLAQRFGLPAPDMAEILEFEIEHSDYDIPVRLYVPHGAEDMGACLVYIHGGGFVTGSIDTHDALCARIALASGQRVLSVEYRLAPRHPFPAAVDDCERALLFAMERGEGHGIDGTKVSLGGDSAGGNISAYLSQKYRRELCAQILLYPLMQMAEKHPSKPGWQDSLMLGYVALNYIEKAYVRDADVHDPKISPLFESHLQGLPPAYVLTCELDPLRDEGRVYADMLLAAGIETIYRHERAVPHGFLNFPKAFPAARDIPHQIGAFLRDCNGAPCGPKDEA